MPDLEVPEIPGNGLNVHPDLPRGDFVLDCGTGEEFLGGTVVTPYDSCYLVVGNPAGVCYCMEHLALTSGGVFDFILPIW